MYILYIRTFLTALFCHKVIHNHIIKIIEIQVHVMVARKPINNYACHIPSRLYIESVSNVNSPALKH